MWDSGTKVCIYYALESDPSCTQVSYSICSIVLVAYSSRPSRIPPKFDIVSDKLMGSFGVMDRVRYTYWHHYMVSAIDLVIIGRP